MLISRAMLALFALTLIILLPRCGKICVAGVGKCEVYSNPLPPAPLKPAYTLTATPSNLKINEQATVKLTTNALGVSTGNCEWDIPTGGGGLSPDSTPSVLNALCTATYTAPAVAGQATLRVKEKNSGNIVQYLMNVTN